MAGACNSCCFASRSNELEWRLAGVGSGRRFSNRDSGERRAGEMLTAPCPSPDEVGEFICLALLCRLSWCISSWAPTASPPPPEFHATLAIVPIAVKFEAPTGSSAGAFNIAAEPSCISYWFWGAKTRLGLQGPRGVGAEITARNRPSCEYALHSMSSPGSL